MAIALDELLDAVLALVQHLDERLAVGFLLELIGEGLLHLHEVGILALKCREFLGLLVRFLLLLLGFLRLDPLLLFCSLYGDISLLHEGLLVVAVAVLVLAVQNLFVLVVFVLSHSVGETENELDVLTLVFVFVILVFVFVFQFLDNLLFLFILRNLLLQILGRITLGHRRTNRTANLLFLHFLFLFRVNIGIFSFGLGIRLNDLPRYRPPRYRLPDTRLFMVFLPGRLVIGV